MDRPHSKSLRSGRFSTVGHHYLLTTCTSDRQPHFADLYMARLLVSELRACDLDGLTTTFCYVVMPDHLHWLIELKQNNVSALMRRVKARVSIASRRFAGNVQIWQSGFHDRAVRDNEDLLAVARYVVCNPIRKGLVSSLNHYSHWDAIWLQSSGQRAQQVIAI